MYKCTKCTKHETKFCQFLYFRASNSYQQSTYRYPPLHQIGSNSTSKSVVFWYFMIMRLPKVTNNIEHVTNSENQEKCGMILGTYQLVISENLKILKCLKVLCTQPQDLFCLWTFVFLLFWFLILYIMKSWKVEDEEWPDINFPLIKFAKVWIWISFQSKNMKRFSVKTNHFFYFRAK